MVGQVGGGRGRAVAVFHQRFGLYQVDRGRGAGSLEAEVLGGVVHVGHFLVVVVGASRKCSGIFPSYFRRLTQNERGNPLHGRMWRNTYKRSTRFFPPTIFGDLEAHSRKQKTRRMMSAKGCLAEHLSCLTECLTTLSKQRKEAKSTYKRIYFLEDSYVV